MLFLKKRFHRLGPKMRSPDKVESRHRLPLSTPMAHGRFTKWPSTPLSALPRWYLQGIPNQQVEDGSDFAPVLTKTKQLVILCRSTKAWSCWAKGFFLFEPSWRSLIPTKLQATRHLRLGIGHFRGQGHPATEHLLFEAKCDCSKLQAQQVSAMSYAPAVPWLPS